MTNSTPKLSDKIERQASPNSGSKRQYQQQQQRSNSMKLSTFFNNSRNNMRSTVSTPGRLSLTPPCSKNARNSPFKYENISPRGSPTNSFYAGAKFSEPPSPASLPKPPSHWTMMRMMNSCQRSADQGNHILSHHLKLIMNAQA
ncbi:proline-rich nuclear receptor coactivator 2 [Prorops nasuta]|uniref:proline-rich nuclear receptor coactivator 2 n=1 Tax=Prorops nasuta TaxID=863751 RepID=UPI0034CEEFB4